MNKKNLRTKIFFYFIVFFSLLLLLIYILQISFLPTYYEYITKKQIKRTANSMRIIVKSVKNPEEVLNNLSYKTGICIEMYDSNKNNVFTNSFLHRGCLFNSSKNGFDSNYVNKVKSSFLNSIDDSKTLIIKNDQVESKTILYGFKLDNGNYALLNTSLEPIENSISVLKSQFIYIVLAAFVLAFIISFIISKIISKPIVDINNNARKLAKGRYDISFKTNSNISEINELSETLDYARNELENTEKLRRDLMANVSHDLKTPLTMIKAYAEMIRDLDNDNKEKEKENLNVIIDECDRLNELVNDILELSKIQSNIEQIKKEEINLVKLINNILKRYEVLKEKENYKFIFECKEEIIIKADKQKLEQVIYNLINNAIKYTGKDKKVEIKITKIKNKIKISVIDTGKGIDKKEIKYIWDKYYKVDKKYKRNIVGTGLGLNIVKNVLEQHNFKYGVISKKNVGTEFYFYIDM